MPQFAKNTTLFLIRENMTEYSLASGITSALTSPASVIGRVRVQATTIEFAASQIAGTNAWGFEYSCPLSGDTEWTFEFTKSSKKSLTTPETFTVVDGIPDV